MTQTPTHRPQVTVTMLHATATTARVTATVAEISLESAPFPLSESGPYLSGKRTYALQDVSRENRPVSITIWYPALRSPGSSSSFPKLRADPDFSGAPYPLILSSTKVARIFAPYIISHGFTWVSVDRIDTYYRMNDQMYQQPLDILFALDQVASNPPEGLEGMIDAEHAGAIGYSFDGYNTLAMSGARIDPEYYLAQCTNPDGETEAILSDISSFNCGPAKEWDIFTDLVGESITTSEDGLWQPMTDERIQAVMPLAPEGWWLFGERGLATVDMPTLMIASTNDSLYPEDVLIFEHLGTDDKNLISFIGQGHMMIYEREMKACMAHFAVVFFGYHLQGREDYAQYFSKEFVEGHEDLAWGVDESQTTATPTQEPPTATPTQVFTLITSAEELVESWHLGNFYIRFDKDGTFRQAHALDTLDSQPYAISSYHFEGSKMLIAEIPVSGVPSCGKKIGSYEIRLLESGNIHIVDIKDQCTPRAGDIAGEYEPVR